MRYVEARTEIYQVILQHNGSDVEEFCESVHDLLAMGRQISREESQEMCEVLVDKREVFSQQYSLLRVIDVMKQAGEAWIRA